MTEEKYLSLDFYPFGINGIMKVGILYDNGAKCEFAKVIV